MEVKITPSITVNLGKEDIRNVVDSAMVYPKTSTIIGKELADDKLIKLGYKCEPMCSFGPALEEVSSNPEFKALGCREILSTVISTIDSNQELFLAKKLDGYLFQVTGLPVLFLKNDGKKDKDSTRTGFVDLTEVRKRAIYKHDSKPMTDPAAFVATLLGGAVMGAFTFGSLLRIFRTIPK